MTNETKIVIAPVKPETAADKLRYEIQWHLDAALKHAESIYHTPLKSNLHLLSKGLHELLARLEKEEQKENNTGKITTDRAIAAKLQELRKQLVNAKRAHKRTHARSSQICSLENEITRWTKLQDS